MVTYVCPRCDYETNKKCNMSKHIKLKTPCKVVNLDVDLNTFKSIILKEDDPIAHVELKVELERLKLENGQLPSGNKQLVELERLKLENEQLKLENQQLVPEKKKITYVCPRCDFTTDLRYVMRCHIMKKDICEPTIMDIDVREHRDIILRKEDVDPVIFLKFLFVSRINITERTAKALEENIELLAKNKKLATLNIKYYDSILALSNIIGENLDKIYPDKQEE